ncbi:MAG: hypothetical protein JOS17DRAFT_739252 [Linnemannia elongata]|nr:MAG: hypothetical protein JOS17DRAFT_739252 [Linnemannia elongata]
MDRNQRLTTAAVAARTLPVAFNSIVYFNKQTHQQQPITAITMGKNTVAKRRCLHEGVVSSPSSASPETSTFSSTSSSSASPSPSSSPSPTYKVISSRPLPYHKWIKRGNGRYNADDMDTENDSTVMDSGIEGYESDASSSSCESRTSKRAREGDSDDDEDTGDERSASNTTMAIADFDAGDLDTPDYLTAQTPGTVIRMFNKVAFGGGSLASPASPASLARSIDLEVPRKLSDYKGYKKALYHISEMATFDEDVEYAMNNEPLNKFLSRMEKRDACETDPEDEDVSSGLAFAATRAVAYPESESEDDREARTRGDITPKAVTIVRKYDQQDKDEDHQDGDSTPKAFGPKTAFYKEEDQNAVDLANRQSSSYDDTHSGQNLNDGDSCAHWAYYRDCDQEIVPGHGSGEDEEEQDLDEDYEKSFGRNYKALDSLMALKTVMGTAARKATLAMGIITSTIKTTGTSRALTLTLRPLTTLLLTRRLSRKWIKDHYPLACPIRSSLDTSRPFYSVRCVY